MRIFLVAVSCAAAIAAGFVVTHHLYLAVVTGVVSGLLASFVFLYVLSDLRPKVKIAPILVRGPTLDGGKKLSIKIINQSGADLIEPKATLHALHKVERGIGARDIAKRMELVNDTPFLIRGCNASRGRENEHIYIFNSRITDEFDAIVASKASIRFRLIAQHPMSGVKQVFEKIYSLDATTLIDGRLKSGENFDVEPLDATSND